VRSRGGEEGKQRIERLLRNPPTIHYILTRFLGRNCVSLPDPVNLFNDRYKDLRDESQLRIDKMLLFN